MDRNKDKMRSINKTMINRLVAQNKEAELHKMEKVSSNVSKQIDKYSDNLRSNDEFYVYSSSDLKADVEENIWNAIIRIADFYNVCPDIAVAQKCAEAVTEGLLDDLRVKLGVSHGVGAYEPNLPGQNRQSVVLKVEEDVESK
jgi:hypothetical protein